MSNANVNCRHLATLGLVAVLAGCGGGGGGAAPAAQCTADCISGQVQSASGGAVAGVYVTATNSQTGAVCATSTAPTNANGSYVISLSTCGGGQLPVVLTAPGGVSTTIAGGSNTGGANPNTGSAGSSATGGGVPTSGGGGTPSGTASSNGTTAGTTSPPGGGTSPASTASTPSSVGSGTSAGTSTSGGTNGSSGGDTGLLVNTWAPGQSTSGIALNPTTTSSIAAFAGTWSASYVPADPRGDSGSCSLTVSQAGVIAAAQPNCMSVKSGPFILTGTINSVGQFGGGTSTGGRYTGSFTSQQYTASGSWKNGNDGGSWSASKTGN